MSLNKVFDIAGTGMSAQTLRLNTTASNLANAQSVSSSVEETYRARKPVFQALADHYRQQGLDTPPTAFNAEDTAGIGVQVAAIVESDAPLQRRYEPSHPMANEEGYVFYPNVNVVEEMTDMLSASRSFQTNVEVMETAKQMMQRVLTLGS